MNQSLNNIMTTSDRKRGVVVKGEGLRMDDSQVHLVPLSCRKEKDARERRWNVNRNGLCPAPFRRTFILFPEEDGRWNDKFNLIQVPDSIEEPPPPPDTIGSCCTGGKKTLFFPL